jgi:hypothetical protein
MLGPLSKMSTAQLLVLAVVAVAAYGVWQGWDFCGMVKSAAGGGGGGGGPSAEADPAAAGDEAAGDSGGDSGGMKGRMARRAGCAPCRGAKGGSIRDQFAQANARNTDRFRAAEAARIGRDGVDVFARGRATMQETRIARAESDLQRGGPDAMGGALAATPGLDFGVSPTEYTGMAQMSLPAETGSNHRKWVASLTEGRVGESNSGMSAMAKLSTMSAAYGVDREESPLQGVRGLWPILTARDKHRRMFAAQPSLGDTDGRDTTPGVSVLGTPVVAALGPGSC